MPLYPPCDMQILLDFLQFVLPNFCLNTPLVSKTLPTAELFVPLQLQTSSSSQAHKLSWLPRHGHVFSIRSDKCQSDHR